MYDIPSRPAATFGFPLSELNAALQKLRNHRTFIDNLENSRKPTQKYTGSHDLQVYETDIPRLRKLNLILLERRLLKPSQNVMLLCVRLKHALTASIMNLPSLNYCYA